MRSLSRRARLPVDLRIMCMDANKEMDISAVKKDCPHFPFIVIDLLSS